MPVLAQSAGGRTQSSGTKKAGAAIMMQPMVKSPDGGDGSLRRRARRASMSVHVAAPLAGPK
jgi:hypothetical protein